MDSSLVSRSLPVRRGRFESPTTCAHALSQQAPPEYLPMLEATMKLGVSRQTVLQRVKRGELKAMLVTQGRRKGLRIRVIDQQSTLFEQFHESGAV